MPIRPDLAGRSQSQTLPLHAPASTPSKLSSPITSSALSGVEASLPSLTRSSTTAGVRSPDHCLRQVWHTHVNGSPKTYSRAISVTEVKPFDSDANADRTSDPVGTGEANLSVETWQTPEKFEMGTAQLFLYLLTAQEMCGTYLGMLCYGSRFQRCYHMPQRLGEPPIIAVEVTAAVVSGGTATNANVNTPTRPSSSLPTRALSFAHFISENPRASLPWDFRHGTRIRPESYQSFVRFHESAYSVAVSGAVSDVQHRLSPIDGPLLAELKERCASLVAHSDTKRLTFTARWADYNRLIASSQKRRRNPPRKKAGTASIPTDVVVPFLPG